MTILLSFVITACFGFIFWHGGIRSDKKDSIKILNCAFKTNLISAAVFSVSHLLVTHAHSFITWEIFCFCLYVYSLSYYNLCLWHHIKLQATKKIADAKLAKDFQAVLKEFQKAQRLAVEREAAYAPFFFSSRSARGNLRHIFFCFVAIVQGVFFLIQDELNAM